VIVTLLAAALGGLLWLTRAFTAIPQVYYMTGPSMVPSVGQGAWFWARPLEGPPARGALVLVALTLDDSLYSVLRRVVGLAGDTLAMRAGALTVNGRPAPWPARVVNPHAARSLDGPIAGTIYDWGPVVVGPESLFVLSDTRDMFGWPDSRWLGAVPREQVTEGGVRTITRGSMSAP
jgi:signal peptidase I